MNDIPANIDLDHLRQWTGRTEEREGGEISANSIAMFNATLDYSKPFPRRGNAIPPIAYQLLFPPLAPQSELKDDGHIKLGEFFPPIPLPRRMNGGSRLKFIKPLHIGEKVRRVHTIGDITFKQGSTGPLLFVLFRAEIFGEDGLAVVDDQDIIYREAADASNPAKSKAPAAPGQAVWRRTIDPDPMLLFRYSAITFNAHRIHYDLPYVTGVEGYPGLIVQGPLTALLLFDLFERNAPGATAQTFSYRATGPLFSGKTFDVCGEPATAGGPAKLWTIGPKDAPTMSGEIEYKV